MLLVGLAGCVDSASAGSPPANGDSTAHPATTNTHSPADERPSSDLRDEHLVKWTRYDRVGDQQIRLHFMMGSPRCYGVRADVRESAKEVAVTLFQGTVPDAPANCPLDAVEASLLVSLRAPVDDRRVTQP